MSGKIVDINGKKYDSISGLPVAKSDSSPKSMHIKKPTDAKSIHSLAQKSQLLYRRATSKPIGHGVKLARKVGHSMDIARSKSISHFAPHTAAKNIRPTITKRQSDIGPTKHPLIAKIERRPSLLATRPVEPAIAKSPKAIKEEAIAEALKKPAHKPNKKSFLKRHSKFINAFTISMFLLIVIGCLTYFNMPSLSVRIAGTQAGINAKYPEYHPDGYSLSGPVTYSNGEVTMNFHANTGDNKFTIEQSKSSWDSTAVKDMVNKDSKGEFMTTEERGLTIYTYNGNAAWVNGGILYTITGNAKLSPSQIRHIATSL